MQTPAPSAAKSRRHASTLTVVFFILYACASDPAPKRKADKVLTLYEQWAGSYVGALPCPDCDSLVVSLNLLSDSTGLYTMLRAGKEKHPFTDLGVWEVGDKTLIFSGKSGQKYRFRIEADNLRQLQADGGEHDGKDAERYLLTKL
ncbi:MAG: copper resistance protein NlpE N-terminal domain-containing protein [Saprospiraceae bacterium]